MSPRPILVAPHPNLRKKAAPVQEIDGEILGYLDEMAVAMREANGIGLAGPQIDLPWRLVLIDLDSHAKPVEAPPLALINPEIIDRSTKTVTSEEGCLSLPDIYADIPRAAHIRCRYLDREGKLQEVEADGLLSACIQHEIDHLDGVLFIDYLSQLKRNMILRKMKKRFPTQQISYAASKT